MSLADRCVLLAVAVAFAGFGLWAIFATDATAGEVVLPGLLSGALISLSFS